MYAASYVHYNFAKLKEILLKRIRSKKTNGIYFILIHDNIGRERYQIWV